MSQKGHLPIRTCIGCGKKRKKKEMIWLAQSPEGMIRVNGKKPHRGRGFYLCPDLECLKMVKGRKKGVGGLRAMDVQSLLGKGLSERDRV